MTIPKFQVIEKVINSEEWYYFGKKDFECSGLDKASIDSYLKEEKLPKPCNECYKALIFLENNFSEENISNLFKMLHSIGPDRRGKLDRGVVVFYFKEKSEMLSFLDLMKHQMPKFNIAGRLQWRRACKEYQNLKPSLWKNAKVFFPDPE